MMALALKRSIKDVSLHPPQLGSGLVVAAGGCGHAAKGCDEIGRVAMVLALEERWVVDRNTRNTTGDNHYCT